MDFGVTSPDGKLEAVRNKGGTERTAVMLSQSSGSTLSKMWSALIAAFRIRGRDGHRSGRVAKLLRK